MMKVSFDNKQYLKLQGEKILERVAQFDEKLYIEFGGKMFDDFFHFIFFECGKHPICQIPAFRL